MFCRIEGYCGCLWVAVVVLKTFPDVEILKIILYLFYSSNVIDPKVVQSDVWIAI